MTEIACVVQSGDALGESCVWCPATRRVWWLDILKPCLQSYDPVSRQHQVYPLPGRNAGNLALRKSGGFAIAIERRLAGFDPATGQVTPLVEVEHDLPENRFNDGRCDRRGRLWIGTMHQELKRPSGSLYRIGADRSVQQLFGDIVVPNSTAFSPDDRTMYFANTPQHAIWAFDFDIDDGVMTNRRVFADLTATKGLPDGSCVDADGFLWNAQFAGQRLVRYAPDGRVDRVIDLPVKSPTCCCFGGEALDTLYVVSSTHRHTPEQRAAEPYSGGLLALDVGARGLPEAAFGG